MPAVVLCCAAPLGQMLHALLATNTTSVFSGRSFSACKLWIAKLPHRHHNNRAPKSHYGYYPSSLGFIGFYLSISPYIPTDWSLLLIICFACPFLHLLLQLGGAGLVVSSWHGGMSPYGSVQEMI